ncbi:MAG TPA: hypothetical protein VGU61_11590 [Noviherbaspirillum sp.]|jgi:hypothetical protein|nr:hypothetical protein [Noviherbaspirillum sp.]
MASLPCVARCDAAAIALPRKSPMCFYRTMFSSPFFRASLGIHARCFIESPFRQSYAESPAGKEACGNMSKARLPQWHTHEIGKRQILEGLQLIRLK